MFSLLQKYSVKSNINEKPDKNILPINVKIQKPQIEQENEKENDEARIERLRRARITNLQKARESQQKQTIKEQILSANSFKNVEVKDYEKKSSPTKGRISNQSGKVGDILCEKKPQSDLNESVNSKSNVQKIEQEDNIVTDDTTKKKYKRKSKMEKYKMWTNDSRFVAIDYPIELTNSERSRFKVVFRYYDHSDKKIKRKTINFGKRDCEYLIDHNNDEKNKSWLARQRGYYTPFHKNFWISCLLCSENTVEKAYNKLISTLLV